MYQVKSRCGPYRSGSGGFLKRRRVLDTGQVEDDAFREGIVWFKWNLDPANRGEKIRFIETARRAVKALQESTWAVGFVDISVFMVFIDCDQKARLGNQFDSWNGWIGGLLERQLVPGRGFRTTETEKQTHHIRVGAPVFGHRVAERPRCSCLVEL